ncbi:hypothetical protein [Streptomyces sp. NPDC055243]|uniref:hypothetical protein n=1 Tax=Streptomyces sp. NPDC055243 TaxID=3365720 RepID=UPI0037D8BA06
MARIQILELPMVHVGDVSETPFLLVIDQWTADSLEEHAALTAYWDDLANKIGARGVLCTDRTIDIPANGVEFGTDAAFKADVQDWAAGTNETLWRIVEAVGGTKRPRRDTSPRPVPHDYAADA